MTTPVKYTDLKKGDWLVADGGFDCVRPQAIKTVHQGVTGFYVNCDQGKHWLDRVNEDGIVVGFSMYPEEEVG